jgi:osmotically-inducible protein OsmY
MGRNLHRMFTTGNSAAGKGQSAEAADELIRLEILNALHWDLAAPRNHIRVEVRCGHVTLTGVVDRAYSKACVERDARDTARVAGVTNAIVLDGPDPHAARVARRAAPEPAMTTIIRNTPRTTDCQ